MVHIIGFIMMFLKQILRSTIFKQIINYFGPSIQPAPLTLRIDCLCECVVKLQLFHVEIHVNVYIEVNIKHCVVGIKIGKRMKKAITR